MEGIPVLSFFKLQSAVLGTMVIGVLPSVGFAWAVNYMQRMSGAMIALVGVGVWMFTVSWMAAYVIGCLKASVK